uniref:ALMS motif domain-containing protein n=1 Tax=Stegastes partitus TaxID=144197 RepID=A0A3B5BGU4_9TELE
MRLALPPTSVPVLLPYKPRGSEELFYVPQTEADVSSTETSDTTMESSHTGSDDAVPPRFSSEVLGHQDPGLDRGVTIRHSEGIYSKRLKTTAVKMQEPAHTGERSKHTTSLSSDLKCETFRSILEPECKNTVTNNKHRVSAAFNRVPSSSSQEAFRRDQGTSPIQFLHYDQPQPGWDRLQPVHVERNYDKVSSQVVQTSISQTRGERDHQRRNSDLHRSTSQQTSSSLDQLWQKFCEQWTTEESRPTRESETSLLERLERLSRLIHSTRAANVSAVQQEEDHDSEQKLGRRREEVTLKQKERKKERSGEVRRGRKAEPHIQLRLQKEETSHPAEDNSRASFSSSSCLSQHLSPAESETPSTASGSMSSVDTARLIRVFGADRVQHLKNSSSLSKLYRTIDKQRDGREQRRGRNSAHHHIITPSETTGTDESVCTSACYCLDLCTEVEINGIWLKTVIYLHVSFTREMFFT